MKSLIIEQLRNAKENRFFSGEGIIKLIPKEEVLNKNWLITDYDGYTGLGEDFKRVEKESTNGDRYMWFTGEELLGQIEDIYIYEGVLTGFSPSLLLEDILTFGCFPSWEGYKRDIDIPYIQHPLGEIELRVDDLAYYIVVSDDKKLLQAVESQCKVFNYDERFKKRIKRRFGKQVHQQRTPTGVGNWWLEFEGKPIRFEVLDGTQSFLRYWSDRHPEWVDELEGRIIFVPDTNELRSGGTLQIKCDLPMGSYELVDVISDEWNQGNQYQIQQSNKNLNFGVAQYYEERLFTRNSTSLSENESALDISSNKFPSYFIEGEENWRELKFVLSWGHLKDKESLVINFAADFEREEIAYEYSVAADDKLFTIYTDLEYG